MRKGEKSRNIEGRFLTAEQFSQRMNLSRTTAIKLANEADALVRFGRCLRIDVERADNFLHMNCKVKF